MPSADQPAATIPVATPEAEHKRLRADEEAPPSPKRQRTDATPDQETPMTAPKAKAGSSSRKRKSAEPIPLTPEEETQAIATADEMLETVDPSWKEMLRAVLVAPDGLRVLSKYNKACAKNAKVFPPRNLVLNAFRYTSFENTRVVILGQDPYHREGQAMGLAFSVPKGVGLPPSLKKIYEELGVKGHTQGDLTTWCEQGVLLLNPVLTVEEGKAGSHQSMGWNAVTDAVLERLSTTHDNGLVFMLWGNKAQAKGKLLDQEKHLILNAAHPSPLATKGGFLGCRHFELANEFLQSKGFAPIDWKSILEGVEIQPPVEPTTIAEAVPEPPMAETQPPIAQPPMAEPPVTEPPMAEAAPTEAAPSEAKTPSAAAPALISDPTLAGASQEKLSEVSDKTEGENE